MRIKEITEAISVTSFDEQITKSINEAIRKCIAHLYTLRGEFPKQEAAFDSDEGNSRPLKRELYYKLKEVMMTTMSGDIRRGINKAAGESLVNAVSFEEMNAGGAALGRDIDLNVEFVKLFSKNLLDSMFESVAMSYNEDERTGGLFYTFKMYGNDDKYTVGLFEKSIEKTVNDLVSILVHEITHVNQHSRQDAKDRSGYEYRSYLDKTKDEFKKRQDDEWDAESHDEDYWKLYLASPQEVTAFAHQAAIAVINSYGFNQASSVEDLDIRAVDARDLVSSIDAYLHGRFKDSSDPRERRVRQRYIKLAYQEIVAYLRNKIKSFKK